MTHTADMSEQSRWAVPLEQLEGERVRATAEVQPEPVHPDSSAWSGPQLPPFPDGATGADGD